MAYLGKAPVNGFHSKQQLTGDGSTVTFTLDYTVADETSLIVSVGGVLQEPKTAFDLVQGGTKITFTEAPASTDRAYIQFLGLAIVQNLLDVNGAQFILDVDGDTTLTADTDDEIDIRVGGTDISTIKSTGYHNLDSIKFVAGTGDDMQMYHDGTNSYLTNATGALKIATETSGIALTIGHTTSEVTFGDNVTITGTLTVGGAVSFGDFDITNVGSIALDTITNDGTDITLDSSGDIILDAGGDTIFLKDSGTTFGSLDNSSSNLIIKSGTTTAATFSGANVTLAGTVGSGAITSTGTVQGTTITATTNFVPDAADGAGLGTASLEFSDLFLADASTIQFGADQDVTLTHVADTGLLLNSTMAIQFNDASQYINAPSNAILDINATDEIELNATLVDINANADISGTLTLAGNLIVGSATVTEAQLEILDGATVTTTELNLIDGGATVGTGAIADGDGLLINDAGTMRVATVQTLSAYLDDEITSMPNLTTAAALVTVSALDSGTITSGFGAIDNGTSNIRSATITAETAFVPDASGGADLGTTALEFNDAFFNDSAVINFGDDQDTTLTHTDGTGLTLNSTNKLCFNDASQFIQGSSATVLSIGATDEIDLTATTVDLNGTLNVSGVATFQAIPVLPANSIDSDHYVDGSIDNAHIADNAIDSEHYADGSIDNAHIADDAIDSEHYAAGSIDLAHLAADSVDGSKIADDAINSEHYTDASIDTAHIGALQVTGAKLALDHRSANATDDVKTGNQHDYLFFDADVGISFFSANAEDMRLTDAGALHVDDDVIAFSTTISDERLKENIQPIEDALNKVNQLRGVTFTYISDGRNSAGLIAQDVEKVLPSAVRESELPLKIDDGNEYKILQYDQTIGLLVEAIKELTAKVEKLENK